MTEAPRVEKLMKRTVDARVKMDKTYRVWDSELKGFGLKVTANGVKTYFVRYRAGGGRNGQQREYTIARHGEKTAEEARDAAMVVLGAVRDGKDPQAQRQKARGDMTMAALCDLYLKEGVATLKPLTIKNDGYRIERHIKPLLGRKTVSTVTKSDIERFMRDVAAGKTAVVAKPRRTDFNEALPRGARVPRRNNTEEVRHLGDPVARGGKGAATRSVALLGSIFSFAVNQGARADNPVSRVKLFKSNASQRFLSLDELKRLGVALDDGKAAGLNAKGLTVIRVLTLTGARKGEIEGLKWSEVDLPRSCLCLEDSKTGAKVIPLGGAAVEALSEVKAVAGSPFVFPGVEDPNRHYIGTPKVWNAVRKLAQLEDVRLHDLRHTFAALGASSGLSLYMIGGLLGHRNASTTQRYAHLAADPVKLAADNTAEAASAALAGLG